LLLTSDFAQFMLTVIANRFRTSGLGSGGVWNVRKRCVSMAATFCWRAGLFLAWV